MSSVRQQMRKGTTTVVILKLLVDVGEPMYGYRIIRHLEEQREGLLRSEWQGEPGTRRRKLYTVTEAGHRRLKEELAQWRSFSTTLNRMLDTAPEPTS